MIISQSVIDQLYKHIAIGVKKLQKLEPITSITIRVLLPSDMRYPTVGDWYYGKDKAVIDVAETGNTTYNQLIAVHELVEMILCNANGITQKEVDDWDKSHLESDEPGNEPGCPYGRYHAVASQIEESLAYELKVNWENYCRRLEEIGEQFNED